MLRLYLSRTADGKIDAWALLERALTDRGLEQMPAVERAPRGKPYFPDRPELCFSLSHSGPWALCALGDGPVGADVEAVPELKILAASPEAGIYAIKTDGCRQVFLMGHAEYDRDTLRKEYMRDVAAGVDIQLPKNYFPDDDPEKMPPVRWRSCAHLLYGNWLNYCVYQTVPYDIRDIEKGIRTED